MCNTWLRLERITALQKKAQEEREENAHQHSEAITELVKMSFDSFMQPIVQEQQEALQKLIMNNLALQQKMDDEVRKGIEADKEKNELILQQTALYSGLGGAVMGLTEGFADGKLEGKEMFSALLSGATKALPSLIAVAGVSNPFAMAAIGIGITALLGVIKGAVQRFEGGGEIKGKYTGKDDTLILAQAGEYVVPRSIAQENLGNLERLRHTGKWNAEISMAGVERRLDDLINAIQTQKTSAIKLEHNINVDKNKMLKGMEFEKARASY